MEQLYFVFDFCSGACS